MPLQKLEFRPGVNRESTTLANEGGWFECDKVRFRSGFPEKIGGWVLDTGTYYDNGVSLAPPSGSYWGVCRSMWNWNTLTGQNLLGLGTNLKFYIQNGPSGYFYDITPIRDTNTSVANAFSVTAGSATVTVTDPGHGAQTGDFVTITYSGGAIGGMPAAAITGEHQITYISNSQYSFVASSPAVSNAGPTGTADFQYQITSGLATYTVATGWGAGNWGGTTGASATTTLNGALSIVGNTTLAADLTDSATTISVASTATLASSGSVRIDSEIIAYSGVTATTLTGCTRASSSTTAAAHTASTGVIQYSTVTINVTSAAAFATAPGTFAVNGEVIYYGGKTSTSFTGCIRGYSGYVAAHADGSAVSQYSATATGWGIAANGPGVGQQLRLWSQSNYGQDLIFNPRGGAMYYWSVNTNPNIFNRGQLIQANPVGTPTAYPVVTSTGTVYPDSTCPSVANLVMVSDSSRFVIAMGTNDPTGVYATTEQDPLQIRWSQQEEFYTWTPDATNQAGDYRLSNGSEIIGAMQTRQEILIWTDAALYSMQYLGPPYVWGFQIMGSNLSIAGPNAMATANNVTYWMGADKFYMYSGRVETLPCTLRQYVFDDINLVQSYQFFASTNEGYNEIWWFYCSANSNTIDKYVVFNHLERTWYYGTMDRTFWLDSPLREVPMAVTYNENTQTGKLVYQESGNDDGTTDPPTPIEAYVQSSDFDIGDGHNFGIVWRIIPDVTFDGSNVATPSLDFTVRPRQNPGANYGSSDSPPVISANNYVGQRTYSVQQFTEYAYVRIRGRQMAFKVSSNDLGVAWQLGTPRIDVRPDGRR
jgi:hypothetical protein